MTSPTRNGKNQAQEEAIEKVEQDAWLDLFAVAPSRAVKALSLNQEKINGIGLLVNSAVPITELNRAVAIGADAASSEKEIDLAVKSLDENAADGWAVQMRTDATDAKSKAALERAGLEPAGNGSAKFLPSSTDSHNGSKTSACEVIRADAGTGETYGRTTQTGFGLPEPFAGWFAHLVGRPGWSCFLRIIEAWLRSLARY